MRIPFGPNQPNETQTELLKSLGFNLEDMSMQGRYYFLNTPSSPRVRCERRTPDFDKVNYDIFYNDVRVISINQKTAAYDSYVYFNISSPAVVEALAKNAEITEEQAVAMTAAPELTAYQKRLASRLSQLANIIFEGGASRGYGSMIGTQCQLLRELKAENPAEHDALIASNPRYQELLEMFPNWTDSKNLQATYMLRDAGLFKAMSASSEDGTPPECSIM